MNLQFLFVRKCKVYAQLDSQEGSTEEQSESCRELLLVLRFLLEGKRRKPFLATFFTAEEINTFSTV
jgi:hypothetical protein